MRYLFFLLSYLFVFSAKADVISLKANDYEEVFTNKSILSFGMNDHTEVFSQFDLQIILLISNAISNDVVPIVTNWNSFNPPDISSANFTESKFLALPKDLQRILFLCLTWNESERLKLFIVPELALENVANRMRIERPWKNLDVNTVKKADTMSDETLKYFIDIILRANLFKENRGDLLKNKSLWFVPWDWLLDRDETLP